MRGPHAILGAILLAGLGARVFRLDWGLPGYAFPDGIICFARSAVAFAASGEFVPVQFVHPPLLAYVLSAVYGGWSLATGQELPVAAVKQATNAVTPELAVFVLLGRIVCAVIATASVAALYDLARRLQGPTTALVAAATLALAPLHVLESHRINPDGLAILLGIVSASAAAAAADRRARKALFASFALAGLAGATKYTGLLAVSVPAWVAIGWPKTSWSKRLWLLVLGGGLALGAFGIAAFPTLAHWDDFVAALRVIRLTTYTGTPPGQDLQGQGWLYTRYVYPLVVTMPYMMGWPLYLAGLAGLAVLVSQRRRGEGIVLAALLPFLLVQGSSPVAVARYYQPALPYLALAAGIAFERLRATSRGLAFGLCGFALAYTAVVTGSQCARLGLGPQRSVGVLVAERARGAAAAGRRLVVAYPDPLALFYDAVRPQIHRPETTVVFFPLPYASVRSGPAEVPPDAVLLDDDRRWIANTGVDVVVLPSWIENTVRRERPDSAAGGFIRRLGDGRLGFHLGAEFRTPLATEWLYTWGDPILDTHWETGIVGYKVFVR